MPIYIRSIFSVAAVIAISGYAQIATASDAGLPSASTQASGSSALQPWQKRRKEFVETIKGLRENKPSAVQQFDAVLTEFDTQLLSRTPIENMEILGIFYVPKDGVEKAFLIVVLNAVLGWYDALRFTSESGRVEILNNEAFFKRAFTLGGPEVTTRSTKFLEENPERVAEILRQGLSVADKYRDTTTYDHQWPTAYGLERVICANGGACTPPPSLPQNQWPQAWEEAKRRVISYYQVSKPVAPK